MVPFVGTFLGVGYERAVHRNEIKEQLITGMEKNELVVFAFTDEEVEKLEWEHDREFEYKGFMYDVVDSWEENGLHYYKCWPDVEETRLNLKLKNLIAGVLGQDQRNKQQHEQLLVFIKSVFLQTSFVWKPVFLQDYFHSDLFRIKSIEIVYYAPSTPPPRV